MADRLEAFPALQVGDVRVWIDQTRPIAVLQRADVDQTTGWPGLVTGWAAPTTTVTAAPHAVWVHYGLLNSVSADEPLAPFINDVDAPAVHIDPNTCATTIVRVGGDQILGSTHHGL